MQRKSCYRTQLRPQRLQTLDLGRNRFVVGNLTGFSSGMELLLQVEEPGFQFGIPFCGGSIDEEHAVEVVAFVLKRPG